MKKSYVHIYTGNGKGKTTSSFGIAVRSLYAGKKVYIGQFVKGMRYSELGLADDFDNITIEQFGRDCFIFNDPTEEDIRIAREGLERVREILTTSDYDLVILDEIMIAVYYHLFSDQEVIELLESRKENIEVVMTGRYAPQSLIDYADLVTEMREIKHYYQKGVQARIGIEK